MSRAIFSRIAPFSEGAQPFSALTLLVARQKEHPVRKNLSDEVSV